jgi:hypothetical protein
LLSFYLCSDERVAALDLGLEQEYKLWSLDWPTFCMSPKRSAKESFSVKKKVAVDGTLQKVPPLGHLENYP